MLHALLARKVGRTIRRSEDVLTATVFGLLGWTDPALALAPWLKFARAFDEAADPACLGLSGGRASVTLWPRLEVGDGTTAEPDVVIEQEAECRSVVFAECKLSSGPSGWPIEEIPRVTGQLGRQWCALTRGWARDAHGNVTPPHRAAILYVTADWTMPRAALAAMAAECERKIGDQRFRRSVWWLSWRTLPRVLDGVDATDVTAKAICRSIAEYLRALELDCFDAESAPNPLRYPGWSYGGYDLSNVASFPRWTYGEGM